MTYIDAALAVLKKARKPLSASELASRAVEDELLKRPSKNPERSMKTQLKTELKKGADSRIEQVGDDEWAISGSAAAKKATTKKKATTRKGSANKTTKKETASGKKTTKKAPAKKTTKKASASGKKTTKKETASGKKTTKKESASGKKTTRKAPARKTTKKKADAEAPAVDKEVIDQVLAPKQPPQRVTPPLSPEEVELEAIYGTELAGSEPGAAFAEYRDEQTADEDRPMLPEITAPRRDRGRRERGRRDRGEGRGRRRERDRDRVKASREARSIKKGSDRQDRNDRNDRQDSAPLPPPPPALPGSFAAHRAGNAVGDAVMQALDTQKNGQPLQVKQLAQMMRKRNLLSGDPNQAWPYLKSALLDDEQSHIERGLRPRIVYKGKDLFALNRTSTDDLGRAEQAFSTALAQLVSATHQAYKARLGQLSAVTLERIVHVYLLRTGWSDITWIKRAGRASYATATPLSGAGTVLVSAFAGDEPVDRRGIGELRAGVDAKGLTSGRLFASRALSEAATAELAREGKPVSVVCGDAFVSALMARGIGVRATNAPLFYLDETFLDEISR